MQMKGNIQIIQNRQSMQMTNSQWQHCDITPLLKPRLPSVLGVFIIRMNLNILISILPCL